MPDKELRNHGFDALRIVAAAAVVFLHSANTPDAMHDPESFAGLRTACRFAVPFFFIASGYFQRDVTRFDFETIFRPIRRLLPLYVFWVLIYDAVFYIRYDAEALARYNYIAAFHLWFLPALGIGLVILQVGRAFSGLRLVTLLAVALALLGLAFTSYSGLLGIETAGRRGWLFALPFLVVGAWLARTKYSPSLKTALSVTAIGFGGSILEEYLLALSPRTTTLFNHDFLFSTFLFGVGVAFLALWLQKNSKSHVLLRLSTLGRLSLGIYLSHVLFLWIFSPFTNQNTYVGIALLGFTTLLASVALAALLAKSPHLRRIAT